MSTVRLSPEELDTLKALANGIIPPDERDAGAAVVNAGTRIAEKIESGVNAPVYVAGLKLARELATENFGHGVAELSTEELHKLIDAIRQKSPGFFKQLRMDVSALYLSDPEVWMRIGFPGPSTASGGYPDFDKPQQEKITRLKEQ